MSTALSLTDAQIERYSRQILLPEIGGRGQARLLAAHVVLAGAGEAATAAVVAILRCSGWDEVRGRGRRPQGAAHNTPRPSAGA